MLFRSIRGRVIGLLVASLLIAVGVVAWRGATVGNSVAVRFENITLLPAGVEVDAGSVTVSARVAGGLEQGEILARYSRPRLSDAAGLDVWARKSWTDADDSRLLHAEFPMSVESPRDMVFTVGDLSFQTQSEFDAMRRGEGAAVRTASGDWSISVRLEPNPSVKTSPVALETSFGPGSIRITEISRSEQQVRILGEISGFTEDQIPDIVLAPVSLKEGDSELAFRGGRSGFGPGGASFELTFSAPTGRSLTLSVPLNLSGVTASGETHNPKAIEGLRIYAGAIARLEIELPPT